MTKSGNGSVRQRANESARRCSTLSQEIAEASARARQAVELSRRLLDQTKSPRLGISADARETGRPRTDLVAFADAVLQARTIADELGLDTSKALLEAVLLDVGRRLDAHAGRVRSFH